MTPSPLGSPLAFAIMAAFLAGAATGRGADPVLPSVDEALKSVPALFYAETPRPGPAPVIESGPTAHVPCVSFQIGPDRELNFYGDPRHPACIEIALHGSLARSAPEMQRSVDLLHRLVAKVEFGTIRLTGGKLLRNGLMAEVRPPSDPEAGGAWRISLSDLARLNEARVASAGRGAVTPSR